MHAGTVAAGTNYLTLDDLNTNALLPYSLVGRKPVLHESRWLKIKAWQGCVPSGGSGGNSSGLSCF